MYGGGFALTRCRMKDQSLGKQSMGMRERERERERERGSSETGWERKGSKNNEHTWTEIVSPSFSPKRLTDLSAIRASYLCRASEKSARIDVTKVCKRGEWCRCLVPVSLGEHNVLVVNHPVRERNSDLSLPCLSSLALQLRCFRRNAEKCQRRRVSLQDLRSIPLCLIHREHQAQEQNLPHSPVFGSRPLAD